MNNKFFLILIFFSLVLTSFSFAYESNSSTYNNSFQLGNIFAEGNSSNFSANVGQTLVSAESNSSNYSHSFKMISYEAPPAPIIVVVNDDGGSLSGGGGPSGGGVAGVTVSYSVSQLWESVLKNKVNKMIIESDDIAFDELEFTTKDSLFGVFIRVKRLLELPDDMKEPDITNYQFIELSAENINEEDLEEDMVVSFSVNDTWIKDNNLNRRDVMLLGYDKSWKPIKTNYVKSLNSVHYYESDISLFGYYSVSAKKVEPIMQSAPNQNVDNNLVGSAINPPGVSVVDGSDSVQNDSKEKVSFAWLWVVLRTLGILAVIGFLIVFVVRQRAVQEKVIRNPGISPDSLLKCKEFILDMRKLGFKDPQIKKRMMSEGWTQEQLDYLFYLFKK